MITFEQFLILEGGAAGHMAHPFDLNSVKTGNDLVKFFINAEKSISKSKAVVKFDGLNVSVKLVKKDGKLQYALDRGSNKKIDLEGITEDKLEERFEKGHGMIAVGKFILPILNSTIDSTLSDLKQLKLTNSNNFLNLEYITKTTNVTQYDRNMIVVHGINEFFSKKSPAGRTMQRVSREMSYNRKALNSLIEKIKPVFAQHKFEIFGPTAVKSSDKVNYEKVLNSTFGVVFNESTTQTKTLREWLSQAKNPRANKIRLASGKQDTAMTKNNYLYVLNGNPLNKLVGDNPDAQKMIIDGAVFYHATRLLGKELLNSLGSEAGDLKSHEGLVIRDVKIASIPVKITGEFIIKGATSPFRKSEGEESLGGLIGSINYANTTGDYMNKVNYINTPSYGTPPNVGANVGSRV